MDLKNLTDSQIDALINFCVAQSDSTLKDMTLEQAIVRSKFQVSDVDGIIKELIFFFERNLVVPSDLTAENIKDYFEEFLANFHQSLSQTSKNDIKEKLLKGVHKFIKEDGTKDTLGLSLYDDDWYSFLFEVCGIKQQAFL